MSTRSTISKTAAITDPDQGPGSARKRMTVPDFMARKGGEPLVCLTSYTAHVAHICDAPHGYANVTISPYPQWMQSPEFPKCPKCKRRMVRALHRVPSSATY